MTIFGNRIHASFFLAILLHIRNKFSAVSAMSETGNFTTSRVLGNDPPSMLDCQTHLAALQFDLSAFERYDIFFKNSSRLVLPQAGYWYGAEDIEEYFRFGSDSSPYIDKTIRPINDLLLKSLDPIIGTCTFIIHTSKWYAMNPDIIQDATYIVGAMFQVIYDYHGNYISEVHVHFEDTFYYHFFGSLLNTDGVRDFICGVSEACPGTNVGMDRQECLRQLNDLPNLSDGQTFDGKDYGCRVLHAAFAKNNENHCAHISFEPQEDPDGNIKCQQNKGLDKFDFFDKQDIENFREFLDSPRSLIESTSGYKILYKPKRTNTNHLIWFGLVIPLMLFFVTLLTIRKGTTNKEKPTKKEKFLAIRERNLWKIFFAMFACLFVTNIIFVHIMKVLVPKYHPEWDQYKSSEDKFADRYHGSVWKIDQTLPHNIMTDGQFQVYSGIIGWITCLITGIGLEVFFWQHFLQIWSASQEFYWRFAQFLFPLMLLTALGLAFDRNFLSLPFLVIGLWKFGFPEILNHMYLALFPKTKSHMRRIIHFLNGAATIIHHGAATLIVNMLLVGVIPPSRYVTTSCQMLVLQHCFVILSYSNKALFLAIEIVLEYYFQWSIISDFAEIYHLHWTAAWGSSVMVFAHWLYMLGAFLNTIVEENENDTSKDFNNMVTRRSSEIKESQGGLVNGGSLVNGSINKDSTIAVDKNNEIIESGRLQIALNNDMWIHRQSWAITSGNTPTERRQST